MNTYTTIAIIILYIASIALVPWMLTMLPSDYFAHEERETCFWKGKGNLRRLRVKLSRNNLFFLSDKIRDVSYCIGIIKLLKDGYYSKRFNNLTEVYEFVKENNIEFDHDDNDVTNQNYDNINPLRQREHKYKAENKVINNYWAN